MILYILLFILIAVLVINRERFSIFEEECYNTEDPITGNSFEDLNYFEQAIMVKLRDGSVTKSQSPNGSVTKSHCFEAYPLIKWMRRNPTHPITRRALTPDQIAAIKTSEKIILDRALFDIAGMQDNLLDSYFEDDEELFDDARWKAFIDLYLDPVIYTNLYYSLKEFYNKAKAVRDTDLKAYNDAASLAYRYTLILKNDINRMIGKDVEENDWEDIRI